MSFDSRTFRDTLGRFATGVCVITTQTEGVPAFGMTVNSFASLSLDPPLVLWSIGKSSDCFDAFEKAHGYVVNILHENQAELSNRFASKNSHELAEDEWQPGNTGLPALTEKLGVIECEIAQRIDGGDHVIMVGEVKHCEFGEGTPLLFFGGKYGAIKS